MSVSGVKSKSFTFTLNNYTDNDLKFFDNIECSYIIYGKEIGESGTPHLQGFVTFRRDYRYAALKKLHGQCHWEKAIASDAMNYCMKEGDFTIRDNRKIGHRTDIDKTYEAVENGLSMKQFLETKPNFQAIKVFEIAKANMQKKRDFKPVVTWIYGPTGTEKTRRVVDNENDLWISGKNLKWWQGYENQEATLFDDFRGDFCTYHELLRILDRYPYTVEVKGGSRELNSKRMYITSPYHPSEVYKTHEEIGQLIRRIDTIIFTGEPNVSGSVSEVGKGNTSFPNECLLDDEGNDYS